jgi:hypothetical protein
MLESKIEKYLVDSCKKRNWLCEKFTSPSGRNKPDRMITIPNKVLFVECKATGKTPNAGQLADHERRRNFNIDVYVIDSLSAVDVLLTQLELSI